MILTALTFFVILTVLVLIHEAGHFFVAKRLGIKVEEFGFGLPPRLWGKKIGETIYSINWLPIGGFVKLFGEDEAGAGKISIKSSKFKVQNSADEDRAFFSKTPWQRALVVVAGVVMNTLLAIIIFYTFLLISGFKTELPLIGDHKFIFVHQQNVSDIVINGISKNSPAEKAGIKAPAKIVSINNQIINDTKELVNIINNNKGKEVALVWQDLNNNKTYTTKLTPRVSPPKNEGALGISFFPMTTAVLDYKTLPEKIFSGISHPINLMAYNVDVIGKLINVSFKEKSAEPLSNTVSGPVGIYSLVGAIVKIPDLKERILQVLNLAGMLSVSLAFFNILPIPALDGGRLFFILIEGITRRKVPARFEALAHSIGMAILITLIIMITFHDISKFIIGKNPFTP